MIEILIVMVLVVWSALVVFKKVFPKTSSSVFLTLSNICATKGWHGLAKKLKPAVATGCGGNCGCDASGASDSKKIEVQAVKWK